MFTTNHRRFGSVVGIATLLASSIAFSPNAAHSSTFIPPATSSAPPKTTGGASRGTFVPPATSSAPPQTTGGASRGTFVPPATSPAPTQTAGGASRSAFTPPPSSSAPIGAAGGASRANDYGSYLIGDRQVFMTALLPQTSYGTTLSTRPTVLVYLPASSTLEAIFSLKDEAKNLVYQVSVPVSGKSGIVAIQLPENAPTLEVDKNYQWIFALKHEGSLTPSSPFVEGWIKRIAPSADLAQALEGKTALQQSSILAAKGVWYDSASILASLLTAQPNDRLLTKEWKELLESVQLPPLLTSAAFTN